MSALTFAPYTFGDREQDMIDFDMLTFRVALGLWGLLNLFYGAFMAWHSRCVYRRFVIQARMESMAKLEHKCSAINSSMLSGDTDFGAKAVTSSASERALEDILRRNRRASHCTTHQSDLL